MEIISENNKCYLCGNCFKHKRRVSKHDHEVTLFVHCARCRVALRRKRLLEEKMLDVEWLIFGLEYHTEYFDD